MPDNSINNFLLNYVRTNSGTYLDQSGTAFPVFSGVNYLNDDGMTNYMTFGTGAGQYLNFYFYCPGLSGTNGRSYFIAIRYYSSAAFTIPFTLVRGASSSSVVMSATIPVKAGHNTWVCYVPGGLYYTVAPYRFGIWLGTSTSGFNPGGATFHLYKVEQGYLRCSSAVKLYTGGTTTPLRNIAAVGIDSGVPVDTYYKIGYSPDGSLSDALLTGSTYGTPYSVYSQQALPEVTIRHNVPASPVHFEYRFAEAYNFFYHAQAVSALCPNISSSTADMSASATNITLAKQTVGGWIGNYWTFTKSAAAGNEGTAYLSTNSTTDMNNINLTGTNTHLRYIFSAQMKLTSFVDVSKGTIEIEEYYSGSWHTLDSLSIAANGTWTSVGAKFTLNAASTGFRIYIKIDSTEAINTAVALEQPFLGVRYVGS